jgi:hypothetical protein
VIRRLFVRGREGPRAACRLQQPIRSTSTAESGLFEPRAPRRQSPTGTALFAGGYAGPRSTRLPFGRRSLERGQSRIHGSGARGPVARSPALPRAPPPAIARNGSFAPTRSTRTPRVASSWRCGLEFPTSPGFRFRSPLYEPARRSPLSRRAPLRAASHAAPRRAACSATPKVPSVTG